MRDWRGVYPLRQLAQLRLIKWGMMVRSISYCGAPHPTCYSKQPFVFDRIDHEAIGRWIEADRWAEEALETDGILQQLRRERQVAYEAVIVRYLDRQPGTARPLPADEQVALWWCRTGLGRSRYYDFLILAECYVGQALGA